MSDSSRITRDLMLSALKVAIRVRGVDPEHVVLSMVRRIVRADDIDDAGKVRQVERILLALDRINSELRPPHPNWCRCGHKGCPGTNQRI